MNDTIPSVPATRLLVATRNAGKIREVMRLLADSGLEIVGLEQYPDFPDTDEPYDTFAENACVKAQAAADYAGCLALADDSGLEVAALDGRPGVLSARYGSDDAARIERLLAELATCGSDDRHARFVCAIAVAAPGRIVGTWQATCEGVITEKPRGTAGFGFDPVFLYGDRTFAEMSAEEKNQVSHRGRALRKMAQELPGILHEQQ